jgi:hypothetical protein
LNLSAKHQDAAMLVAEDQLTNGEIARRAQVDRSTLARWKRLPGFSQLVTRDIARLEEQAMKNGVVHREPELRIRGLKLQMAIALMAEGNLTDNEVALCLKIRLGTLEELKRNLLFARRVAEERHPAG